MSLMNRIIQQMLRQLIADELLELVPGATLAELEQEIVDAMSTARSFSQATPFLAEQLVSSPRVLELYASDDELRHIMKSLEI